VLQQMATRGDGTTGEDVTHNAPHIQGLPQRLTVVGGGPPPARVAVRGEVYVSHKDHAQVGVDSLSISVSVSVLELVSVYTWCCV
jgi:DNA ligase (NAD+)